MPMIERAAQVRVLIGAPEDSSESAGFAEVSRQFSGWLRDHGVEPIIERYEMDSGDKGEWLLSRAADYTSDLIVMGGYGHARVREMVLGGMTHTILRSMTVPVLMSH
jgi:nucleotide-binding universal stress UspA family protein